MNKIILSIVIAVSAFTINANAQVGIQTSNPQGVFNIDAAKDNPATGVPTLAQQANDIAVTSTGSMGVGTTSPSVKLDVQGSQLLNAAITGSATKNALNINVGQNGYGYGNRTDNYGINMMSSSTIFPGTISRINFGDTSTGTASGPRYLSFSVGITPNELMYLTDANSGAVGVGTVTPLSKFHVEGAEVRLSNGASAWGLDPEGTSPTSQFSIVNRTGNVRHFILQENGNAYLGGTLSTGGGSATISAVGGSVGIGNNSAPTNTLDVNGTTRVRTISAVAGSTAVTPLYFDVNGVLVKPTPSVSYGSTVSNTTVTIASGATGTLITGLITNGIYKISVFTGDACGDSAIAEFYVNNDTNFGVSGLGGTIGSPNTNKSPTFTQTNRTTLAVTWSGKAGCSAGDDGSSLNYTLLVPSSGTVNIRNNGNIGKFYTVSAVKMY